MIPHSLERFFIYYPTRHIWVDPGKINLDYQDLFILTEDGVRLNGWFVTCNGAQNTLLIFHGNAGNISDRLPWIELLNKLGANVLIVDYRGFGRSEGSPFEEGLYRDARATYDWWARERKGMGENLILLGESLGGAVAVDLATRVSPAGLILQSTFTSAWDMAKTMFPLGLLQPLAGVRFDSAAKIGEIECPKLIIHGNRDEIVPFRLGKRLFEMAPQPKTFYEVPGAGHNDLLWVSGEDYSRHLRLFLGRIQSEKD